MARLGVFSGSKVIDLTAIDPNVFASFSSLLRESASDKETIENLVRSRIGTWQGSPLVEEFSLKIPLEPPEVWGGGVTYMTSRDAREVETKLKGLYRYVYDAARPEVFFKTTGIRCAGPEEEVCVRSDSRWSVPEPELGVVFGENFSVVGYTVGNDMSARDIEGENALYLPQAKIFKNCCSLGPVVSTPEEVKHPESLGIKMRILRNSSIAFEGSVSTSNMKRSIDELTSFLKRDNILPKGSVLLTGTGIVPPDDFALHGGDVIEIEIENIGTLRNKVRQL